MWIPVFVLAVGAGLWLRLWISGLDVSAAHTTLHMGETTQLAVARKTWLGTEPLEHPERTKYITTWESMVVVEPDGKVTAVGTWGKDDESDIVMAFSGKLMGSATFSVRADGPGPSLEFVADGPPVTDMRVATCCSVAVQLTEGNQVGFRVLRRDVQHTDVTRRSTGTRYTLFFGSGVPNDPNPAQIVGYGEGINPTTFRIDDERGTILAPTSIGSLNYFTVLAFARNGEDVGWKQFKLMHADKPTLPAR